MKCEEFWDSLPQRGGSLTGEQSDHLAECAACGGEWEPHRVLAETLQSLGQEWRTVEAPPRVEAGLLAAFRAQTGFEIRRALYRSWWTQVIAWASAAAAMIGLAVVLMHSYQSPSAPGTVASPRHLPVPVVQTASATQSDADADEDASVLGEGFVRLPNAPRIDPNEDFNVVRVEVPGSAMIAMGVSVDEDRASEKVVADVALGADGTARAVRLVSGNGTL